MAKMTILKEKLAKNKPLKIEKFILHIYPMDQIIYPVDQQLIFKN